MPRLVLLVAGGLGLAVVARAAALYRGTDPLAFALVLVIGAGLLIGLFELWTRVARANRLGRYLGTLPHPASLDAIDRAPEPLRGMLRARTAGAFIAAPGASLATYLLGMLVMLGMLGTFLGLFESLRGAREALTSGGDVDALRTGLAAPMVGLSRAFGTSATGVSASALLGLALVFTRREEARFSREFAAYASGPLVPLTMQGRTLAALEAVAASTIALPQTATAMQAALAEVEQLEAQMVRERKETGEHLVELTKALTFEVRASLSGMASEVRSSLAAVANEMRVSLETAGQATHASLQSLGEKTAEALRETAREQLEASRSAREETGATLRTLSEETSRSLRIAFEETSASLRTVGQEATLSLRTVGEETSAALSSLGPQVTASLREMSEQTGAALSAVREETSASLLRVGEQASESLLVLGEQTSASLQKVATEAAEVLRETSREQLESSRLSMERAETALTSSVDAAHRAMLGTQEAIGSSLERAASQASLSMREASDAVRKDLSQALEQAGEKAVAAIGPIAEAATSRAGEVAQSHLSRWLERMEGDADLRKQSEGELSDRLAKLCDSVAASVGELQEGLRTQASELRGLASEVREQGKAISATSEARIVEVAEQARLVLERQLEAHVELDTRISKVQAELGGALVEKIEAHAGELRETTTATATLARDAAELLRTGSAEIAAAAELLTGAIDRHREASEKWLDGIAVGSAEPSGRPAAMGEWIDDSLERTREALTHVVELQREMITEVRSLREAPGEVAEG